MVKIWQLIAPLAAGAPSHVTTGTMVNSALYRMIRVVSLEILGGKFPEICYFFTLYVLNIIICFHVQHCKVML